MTQEANPKLKSYQPIWIPFMTKNKIKALECLLKIKFIVLKHKQIMLSFIKMEGKKEPKSLLKC